MTPKKLIYVLFNSLMYQSLTAQPQYHSFRGQTPKTIVSFIERLQFDQDSLFKRHNINTVRISYTLDYLEYDTNYYHEWFKWYDISQRNIGYIYSRNMEDDFQNAYLNLNYYNGNFKDSITYGIRGQKPYFKNFYKNGLLDSSWVFYDLSFNRRGLFKKEVNSYETFTKKFEDENSVRSMFKTSNYAHYKKKYKRYTKDTFYTGLKHQENSTTWITESPNYSRMKDSLIFEKPDSNGSHKYQWYYSVNNWCNYYEDSFWNNRIVFSRHVRANNYNRKQLYNELSWNKGYKTRYYYNELGKIERVEKSYSYQKEYIFFVYDSIGLLKEAIYVPHSSAPIEFEYTYYANDYWIYDKDYKIINPYELRYN